MCARGRGKGQKISIFEGIVGPSGDQPGDRKVIHVCPGEDRTSTVTVHGRNYMSEVSSVVSTTSQFQMADGKMRGEGEEELQVFKVSRQRQRPDREKDPWTGYPQVA